MCFLATAADPGSRRVFDDVLAARGRFDDDAATFVGVTADPDDERLGRLAERLPGVRLVWDFDAAVSRLYDLVPPGPAAGVRVRRCSVVLDERLRVVAVEPFGDPATHVQRVLAHLDAVPPADGFAPVLVLPRVFEPDLCRELIAYHAATGGEPSGFMRDVAGRTTLAFDDALKRRRDREVTDERLRDVCMARVRDRLLPELRRSFQFTATRMERYLVACYDGGHFRPHRDDSAAGTAHRRFAVSLGLNAGEYAGGELRFPEFGRRAYAPPTGGAVVFSCSLLHEVTPVTAGRRYAFLPFLHDEAAEAVRAANATA